MVSSERFLHFYFFPSTRTTASNKKNIVQLIGTYVRYGFSRTTISRNWKKCRFSERNAVAEREREREPATHSLLHFSTVDDPDSRHARIIARIKANVVRLGAKRSADCSPPPMSILIARVIAARYTYEDVANLPPPSPRSHFVWHSRRCRRLAARMYKNLYATRPPGFRLPSFTFLRRDVEKQY